MTLKTYLNYRQLPHAVSRHWLWWTVNLCYTVCMILAVMSLFAVLSDHVCHAIWFSFHPVKNRRRHEGSFVFTAVCLLLYLPLLVDRNNNVIVLYSLLCRASIFFWVQFCTHAVYLTYNPYYYVLRSVTPLDLRIRLCP